LEVVLYVPGRASRAIRGNRTVNQHLASKIEEIAEDQQPVHQGGARSIAVDIQLFRDCSEVRRDLTARASLTVRIDSTRRETLSTETEEVAENQ
jgi:hypothetical protein